MLVKYLCVFLYNIMLCFCYNIIPEDSIIFSDPELIQNERSSYFGYSVGLQLYKNNSVKLVVGAPRGNDSNLEDAVEPGCVYFCQIDDQSCSKFTVDTQPTREKNQRIVNQENCIRDHNWLGATIDTRNSNNPLTLVCAPGWQDLNVRFNKLMRMGKCYSFIHRNPSRVDNNLMMQIKYIRDLSNQMITYGFSAHFMEDLDVLIGAPGFQNFSGAMKTELLEQIEIINIEGGSKRKKRSVEPSFEEEQKDNQYSLKGFAIYSANFTIDKQEHIISGAPTENYTGKVYIETSLEPRIEIVQLSGFQFGEFFGAAVTAGDFDADGFNDLVVGAPIHSEKEAPELGCIYVYRSTDTGLIEESPSMHFGIKDNSGKYARFGTSLLSPGDIDYDGYNDLIVGAPFENEKGAIYIFMGSQNNINEHFTTRLTAEEFGSNLQGFGWSFSRALDVNNDTYPDLVIGSFISENAVLALTRPVAHLKTKINLQNKELSIYESSFEIELCFNFSGHQLPNKIEIMGILSFNDSRISVSHEKYMNSSIEKVTAEKNKWTCKAIQLYIDNNYQHIPSAIEIYLNVTNKNQNDNKTQNRQPVINPYSTIYAEERITIKPKCTGVQGKCVSEFRIEYHYNLKQVTLGETQEIKLEVTITNHGDVAFSPIVTLSTRKDIGLILIKGMDCNEAPNTVKCFLKSVYAPLSQTKFILQVGLLELQNIQDVGVQIEVNDFYNDHPQSQNAHLPIHVNASLDYGSVPENVLFNMLSNGKPEFDEIVLKPKIIVEKKGPSPISEVKIFLNIPVNIWYNNESITIVNFTNGVKVDLLQFQNCTSKTEFKNLENKISYYQPNKRISCQNKNVECGHLECSIHPWKAKIKRAKIYLKINLNIENIRRIMEVHGGIEYGIIMHSSNKTFSSNSAFTTPPRELVIKVTPTSKKINWFPLYIIIAVVIGLLLLLLLSLLLHKVGFFKRKRKDHQHLENDNKMYSRINQVE